MANAPRRKRKPTVGQQIIDGLRSLNRDMKNDKPIMVTRFKIVDGKLLRKRCKMRIKKERRDATN